MNPTTKKRGSAERSSVSGASAIIPEAPIQDQDSEITNPASISPTPSSAGSGSNNGGIPPAIAIDSDDPLFPGSPGGATDPPVNEPYVLTLQEVLQLKVQPKRYLLNGFLPNLGLGLVVARPDSGKSMLARRLALAIVQKQERFLNRELTVKHGRVIYVSTEDNREETQRVFDQMLATGKLTDEQASNLVFIFTEAMSPDEIIAALRKELANGPVDLVILDTFGDVFSGKDANSNSEVRKFLINYYQLINQHKFLLLFIHHLNKSGYDDRPSQRHVQGASALAQKVRVILQLLTVPHDDDHRYLLVIKGNSLPKEHKRNAIELRFDETTLDFSNTGKTKNIDEFGKGQDEQEERVNSGPPPRDYNILFRPLEYSVGYNDLVRRAKLQFKISEITAKRDIQQYLLKTDDGRYTTHELFRRRIEQAIKTEDDVKLVPEADAWYIPGLRQEDLRQGQVFRYKIVPSDGKEAYFYVEPQPASDGTTNSIEAALAAEGLVAQSVPGTTAVGSVAAVPVEHDYDVYFQEKGKPVGIGSLVNWAVKQFGLTETEARKEIRAKLRKTYDDTWETHANFLRRARASIEVIDGFKVVPVEFLRGIEGLHPNGSVPTGVYKVKDYLKKLVPYEKFTEIDLPSDSQSSSAPAASQPGVMSAGTAGEPEAPPTHHDTDDTDDTASSEPSGGAEAA